MNKFMKILRNQMVNLIEYIKEGLKIGSKTKVNQKENRNIEALKKIDTRKLTNSIRASYKTPVQEYAHIQKMKTYKSKGSNPQRLANSIKDEHKLVKRWTAALEIDWVDCAIAFRNEIIKRGYFSEDELDGYILQEYNKNWNVMNQQYKDGIKKYLDELGIDYEKS